MFNLCSELSVLPKHSCRRRTTVPCTSRILHNINGTRGAGRVARLGPDFPAQSGNPGCRWALRDRQLISLRSRHNGWGCTPQPLLEYIQYVPNETDLQYNLFFHHLVEPSAFWDSRRVSNGAESRGTREHNMLRGNHTIKHNHTQLHQKNVKS